MKKGETTENGVAKSDQFIMYTAKDGQTNIRVNIDAAQNTVWLSQKQMAELFQTTRENVTMHIKNVFDEGELEQDSVCKDFLLTADDGKNYNTKFYNLDVIISVGYRIKSLRGTQFRIWATKVLHEYIKKGFAMNDNLLKEAGGGDYFKELLERIRDIRSSEKVLYRQVLDLFATSIDYDGKSETAQMFFKKMQNKLHYASHGHTAAEVVKSRANAELPFMGLTVFKGTRPNKSEVIIAKNYLTEKELAVLNRIVSAYFDLAEVQAMKHVPMNMADWMKRIDYFIEFNNYDLLESAGKVSHIEAETKALAEYDKYKAKPFDELTAVEKDFLQSIKDAQKLLEKPKSKK
jgi:hypothetical protein